MKKHKTHAIKRIIAGLLAAVLFSALPSCKAPENIEAPEPERVEFNTFKNSLYTQINETEIYKISLERTTETEDGTATMHVFDIVLDLMFSQESLTLFVHCNADNKITSVYCMAGYDVPNESTATICRYLYNSLGLSEMDGDAFYDAFAFLEDVPAEKYEKEENGWRLSVAYQEDITRFYAFQFSA